MRFLLDANTFIQAHNTYYKMNFCSAYWDSLDHLFEKKQIASIDFVRKELVQMGDELSNWVKQRRNLFLQESDSATQNNYSAVAKQVMSYTKFVPGAQQEFLNGADPWLVAKALSLPEGTTIVTQETYDPNIKKKVKLPNICKDFNINCINTFDLLEKLKANFIMGPL